MIIFVFVLILSLNSLTQNELERKFFLKPNYGFVPASNAIGDIVIDPVTKALWVSTASNGVSRSTDGGNLWDDFLSGYGSSALAAWNGNIIMAFAYDTTIGGEAYPKGGGFFLSRNNGETWQHHKPENASKIGRLAYDVSIVPDEAETTIWAACFYGGLLKSNDWMSSWRNVFVDSTDSSLDFTDLSHRFFSFAVDTTTSPATLFAGSAAGIHISTDGGKRWKTFKHNPLDTGSVGITGNWVIAIGVQYLDNGNIIWASTRKALGSTEFDGVSYLLPSDTVFRHIRDTMIVWNFTFSGKTAVFATTEGIFCTDDTGKTIYRSDIVDHITGIRITKPEVVSVLWDGARLWAGTNEGLAYSNEVCGTNWRILGTFTEPNDNQTYAAPSPFSPLDRSTMIVVKSADLKERKAEIYDYSMELVKTVDLRPSNQPNIYIGQWDGKNNEGKLVVNGIYFYRIKTLKETLWGKIVVIK